MGHRRLGGVYCTYSPYATAPYNEDCGGDALD
jgi:hypothetical protein